MAGFGISEIIVILIIALIIFGPARLPALGESLGKAIRGFKAGMKDVPEDEPAERASAKKIE
jgi:sec-independent protein translocase protein TatA